MKRKKRVKGPKAILKYQEKKGIATQAELAKVLGLHESALSRYLTGDRGLSISAALFISEKIGVEMAELFR